MTSLFDMLCAESFAQSVPHFTFEAPDLTTEATTTGHVFAVDRETRTIRGRLVPFGVVGVKNGQRFRFAKGTIGWTDVKHVKLYIGHDKTQAVGVAFELTESDGGLDGAFRVARGPEGDRALTMAEDGVWDGLSVGPREGVKLHLSADGVHDFDYYPLQEASLTPAPVFEDARLSSVSMSNTPTTKEGDTMKCSKCGAPAHAGACDPTTLATFEAANPPEAHTTDSGADNGATFDLGGMSEAIAGAISAGFENLRMPQRQPLDPTATFEVNEPSPYRFDGVQGSQSFSEDMRSYASDPEARQRLHTFMEEVWEHNFAVTTANTASLNVKRNRPDLYVPNLTFTRPLWDMVVNGTIEDKTAFDIPKFASASGLVGAHTEGVEPTPGAFSATSQTVTPTPMSGKVEIVREVWDQGGNPQTDAIIWGEMQNGYFEAIESGIATTLAAVPTAEVNFASAVDAALVDGMTNLLVDLQFTRGGNRFTGLALDGVLGKALINAKDTGGRKLLPVLGATNAQGTTDGGFDGVRIGNLVGRFAWALGATNASKSYLFVPSSVYAWASAPRKFTFEYRVSAIDIAIWGYRAAAVLRDSDVRPLDYTTADV